MNDFTHYGWVRLHRQFLNSDMWLAEPFTKAQAWVDIFANACHKPSSFWVRGNEVKLERGQLGWSEVTLSRRWSWSRDKTRRFLKILEEKGNIRQQKTSVTSIITVVNYERYQSDIQQTRQQTIQQKDSRQDTYKNDKNEENDNTTVANAPEITTSKESEEEIPQKPDRRVKDKEAIYALFSSKKEPWMIFAHERKSALSLFDLVGVEKVKNGRKMMKDNRDDPMCPQADTPSEYAKKLEVIRRYHGKINS